MDGNVLEGLADGAGVGGRRLVLVERRQLGRRQQLLHGLRLGLRSRGGHAPRRDVTRRGRGGRRCPPHVGVRRCQPADGRRGQVHNVLQRPRSGQEDHEGRVPKEASFCDHLQEEWEQYRRDPGGGLLEGRPQEGQRAEDETGATVLEGPLEERLTKSESIRQERASAPRANTHVPQVRDGCADDSKRGLVLGAGGRLCMGTARWRKCGSGRHRAGRERCGQIRHQDQPCRDAAPPFPRAAVEAVHRDRVQRRGHQWSH
mmetsp:Transcript_17049/g.48006  ORF Transcript_17049/g.48006 Transcript_17049/m.48006 type:complete len:259 (+) Transcript_17049:2972-3748(+)